MNDRSEKVMMDSPSEDGAGGEMDVGVDEGPGGAGDGAVVTALGGDGVGDFGLGGGEAVEGVVCGEDEAAEGGKEFDGWVGGVGC